MVLCRLKIKTHHQTVTTEWGAHLHRQNGHRLAFHLSIIIRCCVDVWTRVQTLCKQCVSQARLHDVPMPFFYRSRYLSQLFSLLLLPIKCSACYSVTIGVYCLLCVQFSHCSWFDHQFRSIKFQWHKFIFISITRKLCESIKSQRQIHRTHSHFVLHNNLWFGSVACTTEHNNRLTNWTQSQCAWLM